VNGNNYGEKYIVNINSVRDLWLNYDYDEQGWVLILLFICSWVFELFNIYNINEIETIQIYIRVRIFIRNQYNSKKEDFIRIFKFTKIIHKHKHINSILDTALNYKKIIKNARNPS
jgi:hypothetical protein